VLGRLKIPRKELEIAVNEARMLYLANVHTGCAGEALHIEIDRILPNRIVDHCVLEADKGNGNIISVNDWDWGKLTATSILEGIMDALETSARTANSQLERINATIKTIND